METHYYYNRKEWQFVMYIELPFGDQVEYTLDQIYADKYLNAYKGFDGDSYYPEYDYEDMEPEQIEHMFFDNQDQVKAKYFEV